MAQGVSDEPKETYIPEPKCGGKRATARKLQAGLEAFAILAFHEMQPLRQEEKAMILAPEGRLSRYERS